MSRRRVFTREFKVEAVALVSQTGLSVAEAMLDDVLAVESKRLSLSSSPRNRGGRSETW